MPVAAVAVPTVEALGKTVLRSVDAAAVAVAVGIQRGLTARVLAVVGTLVAGGPVAGPDHPAAVVETD